MDAARGRMRPPPPPRRHPITAAAAAITSPITTATPVAITAPECATIDAPALSRPLSPDAPHGQVHLGTVTTASTVDFQGPPLPQPSPPSPPSPLPPSWPPPPTLPSVATCVGGPLGPPAPSVKKMGHVTAISRAHCGVRTSSLVRWSYNNIVTLRCVADWSWFRLLKRSIPPLINRALVDRVARYRFFKRLTLEC